MKEEDLNKLESINLNKVKHDDIKVYHNAIDKVSNILSKDVLDEGLVFDYIKGELLLKDRTALTCNLSLNTKTVDVLIIGASNLQQRTYDQMIIVDTHVSDILTGGAAVLAGPAAAASMFLLSRILSRPDEDTLSYFDVSGEWKNPQIATIERDDIDVSLIENCEQFLPKATN